MEHLSSESPDAPPAERRAEEIIQVTSDFEDVEGNKHVIEVDKNAPGLFLFDIDGTIIKLKSVHGPAVISLFKETFGERLELPFDNPEFAEQFVNRFESHWGHGDYMEFDLLCQDFGVSFDSDTEKARILSEMVASYGLKIEEGVQKLSPEEQRKAFLPGVLVFLDEMQRRKIPAAIVTGNSRRSAESFAKYLGFGKYFVTGGYDDDPGVEDKPYRRANILRSSIQKCRQKGLDFDPDEMAVFGDTPKDFLATVHEGETRPYTFLFATGDNSLHTLAEVTSDEGTRRPHAILPSFSNIKIPEFFDSLDRFRKK